MYKELLSRITVAILIGLTGCVGPLVPVVKLDSQTTRELRDTVNIYNLEDISTMKSRHLGAIEGISCMNKSYDPPATRENAIDQLRYRSKALGGNGIANVLCQEEEGVSFSKNCWNSVTCNAVAIQVEPMGRTSPIASEQP